MRKMIIRGGKLNNKNWTLFPYKVSFTAKSQM